MRRKIAAIGFASTVAFALAACTSSPAATAPPESGSPVVSSPVVSSPASAGPASPSPSSAGPAVGSTGVSPSTSSAPPRTPDASAAGTSAEATTSTGKASSESEPTGPTEPSDAIEPSDATEPAGELQPQGELVSIATDLSVPWSIVAMPDDSILLSHRDSAEFSEVVDGVSRVIGSFPDTSAAGEGGLLGMDVYADGDQQFLYAYATTGDDNRVVRMPLTGQAGQRALGEPEEIFTGIPKASNHNGGRIKFGPDGMLYVTTGDAGDRGASQDQNALAGKILRMTPEGDVPADNPFPDNFVWSLGHRNPQGIAWASDGTMWAAEFGQNTWDELNVITPGSNYGWPTHEGIAGAEGFQDPVQQWPTDDASPSGIAVVGDTVFMAALGGERLWAIGFDGKAAEWFGDGELGRVRDVVAGPDNSLYLITNNTDGRGEPRPGDEVLYQVPLELSV